ncbi:hypothetical protein MX659_07150 [Coriobacteriia bacterium Es71-Z0120]|uniref:hypothetical protein n=1 Tax=Parvivirga hydrogeniphila TaxID=2939460 RepID=UPI002260F174|nr:hypothetical protein [Parvivirga hydrogeniphila]MCL4079358.1 hypothetical protein [Parvivirga hydrogeniphila]
MVTSGAANGFEQFVYYAGPIIQMLYWIVMAVAAVSAVLLLKRWVDHATRDASASGDGAEADEPTVDIEPFVE